MSKKLLSILVILGMVFFLECKKDQSDIDQMSPTLSPDTKAGGQGGGGGGNGGGGGGNGGGGGGGGNGGSGGLYGDLVICLRQDAPPSGIPEYLEINGEHGLDYFAQPIMVHMETHALRTHDDGSYWVFDLNAEGEVIDDPLDEWIVKEVEFGRLNIVRAPQPVLDAALQEAIGALLQPGVSFITTDASGRLIAILYNEDWLVNYDEDATNDEYDDKTIDSPRENVAIYQELMSNRLDGYLAFLREAPNGPTGQGYTNEDVETLAAGALAAGADKTGNMIVDEIAYMNDWLLDWESPNLRQADGSPDGKGRKYFDYSPFQNYSREDTYRNKVVRITYLDPGGTWTYRYESLADVVEWTNPDLLPQYGANSNNDITGFSNSVDDAINVLEYIHGSDLIVYSPYFTVAAP